MSFEPLVHVVREATGEPAGRAHPAARPRRRRARPHFAARRARPRAASRRPDARRAAARPGRQPRTLVVHGAARRLPRSDDVPRQLRPADRVPRRLAAGARDPVGAHDHRRLLDGLRHVLRHRPRPAPPVARGHPGDERLHPDRRGLGARARDARRAARVHHARRARPGHLASTSRAMRAAGWRRPACPSTTTSTAAATTSIRARCRS